MATTIQEVVESMTPQQQEVLNYLLGEAIRETKVEMLKKFKMLVMAEG